MFSGNVENVGIEFFWKMHFEIPTSKYFQSLKYFSVFIQNSCLFASISSILIKFSYWEMKTGAGRPGHGLLLLLG